MPKYRRLPLVLDAVQFTGDNFPDLAQFFREGYTGTLDWNDDPTTGGEILTVDGSITFEVGDWLIRGIEGEYYPIKDNVFRASYEPAA
ncbi:hypothetical protein ACFY05_32740 [Microtetraspora fusca]|uniref:Uncharacterized protein n=1 Tax=Microtetraspora fusca TaxID=1997 RepID=A0ABW6VE77_MICFU